MQPTNDTHLGSRSGDFHVPDTVGEATKLVALMEEASKDWRQNQLPQLIAERQRETSGRAPE